MDEARSSPWHRRSIRTRKTVLRRAIGPGVLGLAVLVCAIASRRADPMADGGPIAPDGLAGVVQVVATREYHVTEGESGFQAPNRAHDLRTHFGSTGIRVHGRTAEEGPQLLALSLVRVGRGEALDRIVAGELVKSEEARIEIRRPGITEWYHNSALGLEQGFTLHARPPGDRSALILELAVEQAMASLGGDEVVLQTTAGRRLRYGKLEVVDANGSHVAARLDVPDATRIRLVVEDANATYPLVIDPLLGATADARLESDQLDAELGWSVSDAGDVNGDGYSDVIVGAPFFDAGQEDEGAAFIFLGSAVGIAEGGPSAAATRIESNQAFASLGASVSGAGDVNGDGFDDVIVAAPLYDSGQQDEGVAFLFLGSASGIPDGGPGAAEARIQSNQAGAQLGARVSGAGDVNGDGFDDVIVGAPLYDAGEQDEGAAFLFLGSASGMANGSPSTAAAQLESNQVAADMGLGVAGVGDLNGDGFGDILVGSRRYDRGHVNEGVAFAFLGGPSGIADGNPATAAARIESNQASASLGSDLAGAGDVNGDGFDDVIVGVGSYAVGDGSHGAAFVFLGNASGIANGNPTTASTVIASSQAGAFLGSSVSGAGDVNGDGFDDVLVGSDGHDGGQANEGAAYLFLGSEAGIQAVDVASAYAHIEPDQSGAFLGQSVSRAGDVNGDGADDVLVGAIGFDMGEHDEGAAFVYLPEPGSVGLLASGVACLAWRVRRGRAGLGREVP